MWSANVYVVCIFCAFKITGDIKNFVQFVTREIKPVAKVQERQTTF